MFTVIQQAGLQLKPRIAAEALLPQEVDFLDHIISREGVVTDPKKIQRVRLACSSAVGGFGC